jgi:hypothetical protein
MGESSSTGGAGGAKGLAGSGGQIRRTILSTHLRPGDELYFANPDTRQVRERRTAYRDFIARGGTPTYDRSMSVGNLRARVSKILAKGQGYELEVRRGNEKLVEKFRPKTTAGKSRRTVRKVTAYSTELRGAKVLRDGIWRYKVKT